MDQESTPPVPTPSENIPVNPVPPSPKSNLPLVFMGIILLILFSLGGILLGKYLYAPKTVVPTPTLAPKLTVTPTSISDATANWKTYTNTVANFSLRYPMDVLLNQDSKGQTTSTLQVTVTKMSDIQDQPFNFTKETAIKDQQSLQQGKYGEHVDWPTGGSEKVITIGGKPAKTYTVFEVLEACDVRFERTAIVYDQNYQIILLYTGPNTLKQNIPTYLTTDAQNCSGGQVWNQNTHLYQDLEGKTAPESVQNWYDVFDQILSTFKFTATTTSTESLPADLVSVVKSDAVKHYTSGPITANDIVIGQSQVEGNFASVAFNYTSGGGAIDWLAKINGVWQIVAGGQEPPKCSVLAQYNFPSSFSCNP